jgi:hypothetical protein
MFSDFSNPNKPRWTDIGLMAAATSLGLMTDPNVLLAVIKVETGGRGYQANGKLRMLFEPHIFFANLLHDGTKLAAAVNAGVAYRHWGERPYPSDSYARLAAAMAIDETAALSSASWGLPQVMGGNWRMCGFKSPQLMISHMAESEDGQIEVMAAFLAAAGLEPALGRKDWARVARGYNGPGYAANAYDRKLAEAYASLPPFETTSVSAPAPAIVYAKPEVVVLPPPVAVQTTSAAPELGTTTLGATIDTATGLPPSTASAASPATISAGEKLPPAPISDTGVTLFVQKQLRALGYVGVGKADGDASDWTEAAILDFRNSHNKAFPNGIQLPLVPSIDADLIIALAQGPAKAITEVRATATVSSPVVATLPQAIAAGKNKVVAAVLGVPALLAGAVQGVLGNIGDAKSQLEPIRDIAASVPAWAWTIAVVVVAGVVWFNSHSAQSAIAKSVQEGKTV